MRTLIYKRTHPGDPDVDGLFGVHDCMGQVRAWSFDAVIGVGGVGAEPRSYGLDGKVNWIGIGPHKRTVDKRGPLVTFDHFWFRGSAGPDFEKFAPELADRMYSKNVRVLMNRLSAGEQKEVDTILALARDAPPSSARNSPVKSSLTKTKTRGCSC